jgi:YgiT-type zinc finger domain-containing protein
MDQLENNKGSRLMGRCYFCKGIVHEQTIRHVHQWGEKVFIFDNVPAEVCTQCGETYFGPDQLEQMDRIVASPPEPEEVAQVPVYTL